jgi:hypothetical protein
MMVACKNLAVMKIAKYMMGKDYSVIFSVLSARLLSAKLYKV